MFAAIYRGTLMDGYIYFKEPQGMSSHLHAWHQKMRKHLFHKIYSIHMGYPVFGIKYYLLVAQ